MCVFFFFASRRRHTRCALVTGVQTCALPIYETGDTTVGSSEFAREDTIKTGEIGLRAKFRTGGIGHTINASVNHFRSDSHTASMWYGSTMSNLYDPVDLPRSDVVTYAGGALNDPRLTESIRTTSFALADTLAFAEDRVLMNEELRHPTIENRSNHAVTGE